MFLAWITEPRTRPPDIAFSVRPASPVSAVIASPSPAGRIQQHLAGSWLKVNHGPRAGAPPLV
ncbi:hypothetical protein GCM10010214_57030 [Streptomyces abikoensis]|nr:hypothetical protein GCM10010214_57030 [Streptomyces abikoensis]